MFCHNPTVRTSHVQSIFFWEVSLKIRKQRKTKASLFPVTGSFCFIQFLSNGGYYSNKGLWSVISITELRNFRRALKQKLLKFEQNLYYVDPITFLRA